MHHTLMGIIKAGNLLEQNQFGKFTIMVDGIIEDTKEPLMAKMSMRDVRIYDGDAPSPSNPAEYSEHEFTGRVMFDIGDYEGRPYYTVIAIQACPVDTSELMTNPFILETDAEPREDDTQYYWPKEGDPQYRSED